MRKIWYQIEGKWQIVGYGCPHCDKTAKNKHVIIKHEEKCLLLNTLKKKKERESMPVQRLTVNGKVYYRWGDSGKLYEKREDAEKQGRAAYASGYKGKSEEKK
jgi:hypothetical protein